MPGINVEAVKEIVEYAYENDCNYIGINFPMDNCKTCGFIGRMENCFNSKRYINHRMIHTV